VLKRLTIIGHCGHRACGGAGALAPPILTQARDLVFDAYQRASPRAYDPAAPVHIIDIDEAALDTYGQWPWPRSYMAALTDRLFDHGAAAVGYDICSPNPTAPRPSASPKAGRASARGSRRSCPISACPP
jgi:adenylate cyclase